jgi:aminopeptidase N
LLSLDRFDIFACTGCQNDDSAPHFDFKSKSYHGGKTLLTIASKDIAKLGVISRDSCYFASELNRKSEKPIELTGENVRNIVKVLKQSVDGQSKMRSIDELKVLDASVYSSADKAYFDQLDKEPGICRTSHGLRYRIDSITDGPKPTESDQVIVKYQGRHTDGSVFDANDAAEFPIYTLIDGFKEGLCLMPEGSKFTIYVPSNLAYGSRGYGDLIHPGEPIIFELNLLRVLPASLSETITTGVDKSLAQHRKQTISDLRYRLSFNVPSDKALDVDGQVVIQFKLASLESVILDFKTDNPAHINNVVVNGRECLDYTYADEHIIISEQYLSENKNEVKIDFIAGNKPLNRNDEFVYTLLVPDRARILFPCFDQPDLKAEFSLSLAVPVGWTAISNTTAIAQRIGNGCDYIDFAPTEPLSTYLFSFVAGKFQKQTAEHNGRKISAYYRETDPKKVAQLDTIFQQVFYALDWLEEYTGIPYPFAKYDFIILPGFQFGGMEHTGATLYNDIRMWVGETPTIQEELDRALLIAHETSHMWFGDLVTMAWFDDVWTKEVFANYYASVITEPQMPTANHSLDRLRTFYAPALNEDRTDGATPIQQELTNLEYAGLVYNNIIYDKAPVMMTKLVEMMGKEPFQKGIKEYLKKYSYANATWDDLVDILDSHTDCDIKKFCEVWVKEKGLPTITFEIVNNNLIVTQTDPIGRDLIWPQKFNVAVVGNSQREDIEVELYSQSVTIPLHIQGSNVIPNIDGRGYAFFAMSDNDLNYLMENWADQEDAVTRQAMIMTIYENYLRGQIKDTQKVVTSFIKGLRDEHEPLIAANLIKSVEYIMFHFGYDIDSCQIQDNINTLSKEHSDKSIRLQLRRMLSRIMTKPAIIDEIYAEWRNRDVSLWSDDDYIELSYELAIRLPEKSDEIIAEQRSRITNPDKLQKFNFICRACRADSAYRDTLFAELLTPQGRSNEVFAEKALAYLNHFTRDAESVKYIYPALQVLDDVRAQGDIFSPGIWCMSLLNGHHCQAAKNEVERFLQDNTYPLLLTNKIRLAAYPLLR